LRGYWLYELERTEEGKPVDACWDMLIDPHLGDKERTLDRLTRGFQSRCDGLQFLRVGPALSRACRPGLFWMRYSRSSNVLGGR
jgi:hypothetical protein